MRIKLRLCKHTIVAARPNSLRGFSLIEMMVAILLGILLSIGLVTLFGATSKTNRVQQAMAQLQESGRYAISRMNGDLRMVAHQQLNISGFVNGLANTTNTPNGVVNPTIAADVYVTSLALPDFGAVTAPALWPAGTTWPLSQRYMLQGFECSSGTCSPALPTGGAALPTVGVAAGNRPPKSDVLSVRYLNANGWSQQKGELVEATSAADSVSCTGGNLVSITVTPKPANGSIPASPSLNFTPGDLALLVAGSRAEIFEVSVSGSTLSPVAPLGGSIPCFAQPTLTSGASVDVTLYNFSRDFITVTYYLKLDTDPADGTRLIPVLVRRQSNIANAGAASNDQEIVQGAEQLDFLFGVSRADGKISYLTADAIATQSSYTNCPPVPWQYTKQMPGKVDTAACLWRAVKSIEVHVLMDSVNNIDLTPADMAYQYTWTYSGTDAAQTPDVPPAATATMPSGLKAGRMMRREFVSLVSVRNYNP